MTDHRSTAVCLALMTCSLLMMLGCNPHITADTRHHFTFDPVTINVNLQVDKKLEQAFSFEDELASSLENVDLEDLAPPPVAPEARTP